MKLYAQHGYAPSDKMHRALEEGVIDGIILSPRYLTKILAKELVDQFVEIKSDVEVL